MSKLTQTRCIGRGPPLDGWAQAINSNLSGVFHGMQQQTSALLMTSGSTIVNMASLATGVYHPVDGGRLAR